MAAYEAAGETDEWFTPRYIFDALGEKFDLDVACPEEGPRHVPASEWYFHDGLGWPWFGFVWMNPPFGHQKHKRAWLEKFFAHGSGIALVPDRTSAPWFQEYGPKADAICWVSPKIKFERPDGTLGESPGTGTALLAAGQRAVRALLRSRLGFVTKPLAMVGVLVALSACGENASSYAAEYRKAQQQKIDRCQGLGGTVVLGSGFAFEACHIPPASRIKASE